MKTACDIAIVGGGFSGLMVAAQGIRRAKRLLKIVWADEAGRFARGTAYATNDPAHLLNVRASRMSAWPDKPGDFLRWLAPRHPVYGTNSFVPRMIYGDYLDDIRANMTPRAGIRAVTAAAVSAQHDGNNFSVEFSDGTAVEAPCLVLATGNPPCRDPAWPDNDHFIPDFWRWRLSGGRVDSKLANPDSLIVIAGSGLTTVDAVMSLRGGGYAGKILAVSPHGQWPQSHAPAAPAQRDFTAFPGELRLNPAALSYLRAFRKQLATAAGDWRGLVDSVREDTPQLWQALDEREQSRFLRHLLSYWNIHRHRMAPEIHAKLMQDKNLSLMAGRIVGAQPDGTLSVRARGDSGVWNFRAAKIINCTGPAQKTMIDSNRLLADLHRRNLVQPGPLSLGIATPRTPGLFTLGTTLIGERFESVAVPELREQAAEVAELIVKMM